LNNYQDFAGQNIQDVGTGIALKKYNRDRQ
jgi:hypothetical protein